MANFSDVELVSLPDSLSGCFRLCDVVPESLRHYLENNQSKAERENMQPFLAAYWDPVLKSNRAKRMKLFARLLEIGLLRPRPKGTAKYFLGIFFVNKKGEKQKRLILDEPNCELHVCVQLSVSLCSSKCMARIEVCLPSHVQERSPTWVSALESIELSLGMGDIQDCCYRYVLDDEFASYFGVDTVFASELSLSGSCLDGVQLDDHSEVDLLWCCLQMGFSWSLFFVQMTNEKIISSCLVPWDPHIMNDRTLLAIFTAGK